MKHAVDSVDARSMSAVILRMWLGDLNQNSLSVLLGADFSVPGDWVFLALSAMGSFFPRLLFLFAAPSPEGLHSSLT